MDNRKQLEDAEARAAAAQAEAAAEKEQCQRMLDAAAGGPRGAAISPASACCAGVELCNEALCMQLLLLGAARADDSAAADCLRLQSTPKAVSGGAQAYVGAGARWHLAAIISAPIFARL